MNISLEWLSQYLRDTPGHLACADALTMAGLPTENFTRVGDDWVMDVEVTSNRADCLSHLGIARELAALLKLGVNEVEPTATASSTHAASAVSVHIDAHDVCPHYTARLIRGVRVGPSPAWMVRRLEAVGLRSINNIVDVTNYVMFEMGQPLHAFDFARIEGRKIVVRRAREGETLISIDGHTRKLNPSMLVIADESRPVALAGVMGGKESEVSDGTVDVLLEAARFDPLCVRKTSRALALRSDSSYRFERGIDPTLPARASLRAAQLILETAGGEMLSGIVQAGELPSEQPKRLSLRLARVPAVVGVEFEPSEIIDALHRLRLMPMRHGDVVTCTIPPDRLDLNIEIDLVEEVARVIGYSRIREEPAIRIRLTPMSHDQTARQLVRDTLVAAGYFEAVTFSFVSDRLASDFLPASAAGLVRADHAVRKADGQLRPSIIPPLLEAQAHNASVGNTDVQLFELGSVFHMDSAGTLVENRKVTLVGTSDHHALRGTVESLLRRLDKTAAVEVSPAKHAGLAPAVTIRWGGKDIGMIGMVSRKIADRAGLREPPCAAELDLTALIDGARLVQQLTPLPRYPAVRRDLSLVVPESTSYDQIAAAVRAASPKDLEAIDHVTTYRGKPLEQGTKSVTITLAFRSADTTLTSDAVDSTVNAVIESAKTVLGAVVRA